MKNKWFKKEDADMPVAPVEEVSSDKKVEMALIGSALKMSGYDTEIEGNEIKIKGYDGKVQELEVLDVKELKDGDKLIELSCCGKSAAAIVCVKGSKANVSDITDMLNEIQREEYAQGQFGTAMESVDFFGLPLCEDVKSGNEGEVKAGNSLAGKGSAEGNKTGDEEKLSDKEIKDGKSMEGTTAKVDSTEKDLDKSKVKPGEPNKVPKTMSEEAKAKFKEKMAAKFKKKVKESVESGSDGAVGANIGETPKKEGDTKDYDQAAAPAAIVKPVEITKDVIGKPVEADGTSKGDGEKALPDAEVKPEEISKNKPAPVMGEAAERKAKALEEMKKKVKEKIAAKRAAKK